MVGGGRFAAPRGGGGEVCGGLKGARATAPQCGNLEKPFGFPRSRAIAL